MGKCLQTNELSILKIIGNRFTFNIAINICQTVDAETGNKNVVHENVVHESSVLKTRAQSR